MTSPPAMLASYLKAAFRNLAKRKLYSFINVAGLALGIASCILIALYVQHEWSYDRFHANAQDIYRIDEYRFDANGSVQRTNTSLPVPLAPVLKRELPPVKYATRYSGHFAIVKKGDRVFDEEVKFVDADFLRMFSFPLIEGSPDHALDNPRSIVLTRALATKYFGEGPVVGNTLEVDITGSFQPFTVTGVLEEIPEASSLDFQILLPVTSDPGYDTTKDSWEQYSTAVFVQVAEGTNQSNLKSGVDEVAAQHLPSSYVSGSIEAASEASLKEGAFTLRLTNLPDVHLNAEVPWPHASSPLYSYILAGIGLLIVMIACINYTTLSLSNAGTRRTEVGVRKSMGAERRHIAGQFWSEAELTTLCALIVGVGLAELLLPMLDRVTGKTLVLSYADNGVLLGALLCLVIFVGLLSGSYPALFLSRFQPAEALAGRKSMKVRTGLTKGLVLAQFSLSVLMATSSLVMYDQLSYVLEKDLGYNAEQVAVLPLYNQQTDGDDEALVNQLKTQLERRTEIQSVSASSASFASSLDRTGFYVDGELYHAYNYRVTPDYLSTLGIRLLKGRNFSEDRPSDYTSAIIVNEALADELGWEKPLQQTLTHVANRSYEVIGVVENYHFMSLEREIKPMFLQLDSHVRPLSHALVKISVGNVASGVEAIREAWNAFAPERPFNLRFLDSDVKRQYASYERWMLIMGVATGLAIFIAGMGLFGLASITVINKTKEIGIRKALGASAAHIVVLLNKEVFKLAALSLALGVPLSWLVMKRWLQNFAYRIELGGELFAFATLLAVAIAVATVSYHSMKAALLNPANSLRDE